MKISLNGQPQIVSDDATIASLLEQIELPSRGLAVEVNLEIVPGSRHREFSLHEGDRVEVVTFVGGG